MSDETGHYPVVWGMTCYEQAGWKIGTWLGTALKNWWNKATKDENNGITSNNVKAKKIMESVVKNIEFSAGIGQGIYAEFELLETSASVGMYGNYATINYQDGEWYTGQELHTGASLSATQFIEIGFAEDLFMQKGKTVSKSSWYLFNNTQESFTIISAGFYPLFIGGSIRIGFDVITFINDYDTIMGR